MGKLTLSVDDRVVARAKLYAKQRGVSVSEIVESYLAMVGEPPPATAGGAPILRSIRGALRNVDLDDYRKHLAAKYK
jgi:hypothetical protein